MEIITGKIKSAQKVVIYGPEGIGKSTFASQFPRPVFIDTEGGTKHLDVARLKQPTSWEMLLQQIEYVKQHNRKNVPEDRFDTLIIDTADWAEQLCINSICARSKKESIEDFGYGKGYTLIGEEFGRLLNLTTDLINQQINVVLIAHAKMRKFERPDESGAYDRWEMKLTRQVAPMIKEWADMVLFANYKIFVIKNSENKAKAAGGERVIYTSHHPCWDAKNRHELPEELPFLFSSIANAIPALKMVYQSPPAAAAVTPQKEFVAPPEPAEQPVQMNLNSVLHTRVPQTAVSPEPEDSEEKMEWDAVPQSLKDLMALHSVTLDEIKKASDKYYPYGTPFYNFDPNFVTGVLVAAFDQVLGKIKQNRTENIPF